MDLNTHISDLTLGELLTAISESLPSIISQPATVSGIAGLASIFGVSESTAKRIKASGVINRAISQSGRVIVTDVRLARALYAEATHSRKLSH